MTPADDQPDRPTTDALEQEPEEGPSAGPGGDRTAHHPERPRGGAPSRGQLRRLVGVWTLVGVLAAAWLVVTWLSRPFRFLLTPILLASVLIYLLAPVVERFSRRLPRLLATALTYLVVLAGLALVTWQLLPVLNEQLQSLAVGLPTIVDATLVNLRDLLSPAGLEGLVPDESGGVSELLQDNDQRVFGVLGILRSLLGSVVAGVFSVVLAPVLGFYVLADLPRLLAGLQRILPPRVRGEVADVGRRIATTVGGYFRGQLLVATFVGVASALGLALVGLPFWAIIGGLAGVLNLVPLIGPFVGGTLGVVVALTAGSGLTQAIIVVVVMSGVQLLDNHVITPQVHRRTVQLHPLTIILSLAVAASVMGIIGMLVAIPTVAAVKLVVVYVLVTRVPSMRHLSDPEQLIDGVRLPPPEEGSLGALGLQLRRGWEKRFGSARSGSS